MANGNSAEQIIAGLPDGDVLDKALAGWNEEVRAFARQPQSVIESFIEDDLARFIALACASMSPEARAEYSNAVTIEFAKIPHSLLVPALAAARKKVSFPNRLVPFVDDWVEAAVEKLDIEGDRLKTLVEMRDE